ncbi:olfactory receptor 6N2-like [Eucyclogobius newberryi]|uniref:olfactory receptor 6N2-like n=1 Tax=Eucyclogobius newberryi TaxID=166745 RepID=UPI003B5CEA8A
MNVSSVSTVGLDGVALLYEHRLWLALLLLLLYVFVMLSDSLVVYVVCSQRSLHRPMYVFVVAVLVNSAMGSSVIYPKLVWDLLQGKRVVLMSRSACLCQAFFFASLGSSSFLLLSTMSFDRYLSICHPLRYSVLMSPAAVTTLLLLCWLVPLLPVAGFVLIANRFPPCLDRVTRLYCHMHTFVTLSCADKHVLSKLYSFFCYTILVFLPFSFVLFSYFRILFLCLHRSKMFASKALNTCLPHVILLLNYTVCNVVELLQKTVLSGEVTRSTFTISILLVVVTPVCNPIVYGLKLREIYQRLKKLLLCRRITN